MYLYKYITAKTNLAKYLVTTLCDHLYYHRRRNQGAWGLGAPPPIFYPPDLINILACSADRAIAVYITFGPPKMELLPTPMTMQIV